MIGLRQFVEHQHPQHSGERRHQHRHFKGNRNEGGPTVVWLANDIYRIVDYLDVVLHQESTNTAEQTSDKDDQWQARVRESDCFRQLLNRIRRITVDAAVTKGINTTRSRYQIRRVLKLSHHAIKRRRVTPVRTSCGNVDLFILCFQLLLHLGFRQNRAHFKNRDHRQEANKQEQQRKEEPDRSDKHAPVPLRRLVHAPRRRQVIAKQTGNHNHKPFQPHADRNDEGNDPKHQQVGTKFFGPQKLWCDDVAKNQRPVIERIWTVHAVPDHEALVLVTAVPTKKRFHDVAIPDDQSGGEHHLAHIVHMAHGDKAFETVEPS